MGETRILPLLADGQGELEVRNDDLGGAGLRVNPDLLDLRRRQCLGHEIVGILGEGDDVDLLAVQLVDDHTDARATSADAGADRIDVLVIGPDGDLGAMSGFTGAGLEFDDAVRDLGHFEFEQPLDETGVGAADNDLGALRRLTNLDDVGLEARARLRPRADRHLLCLGQERLDATEVDEGVAGVGLLHDAGDDLAFLAGVVLVLHLPLFFANALHQHLLGGLSSDSSEVLGGDVHLGPVGLAILVEVLGVDLDVEGGGVDRDPGVLVGIRVALVGRLERVGQNAVELLDGDVATLGQRVERLGHFIAHDASPSECSSFDEPCLLFD